MESNTCVDKYCVFWHPTIFHNELLPIEDFASILFFKSPEKRTETKTGYVIEDEISDDVGKDHHVKITLDKETKNLFIESNIDGTCIVLELKFEEARRNGLVLYSYQLEEKSKSIEFVLKHGVYHLAKSFYHSHELKNGSDAILYAYIVDANPDSSKKFSLTEDDNPALVHFLALYERKFKYYAESISEKFAYLEERRGEKTESERTLDRTRQLNLSCENALIEYIYCKTLFESKYNKLVKVGANSIIDDPESLIDLELKVKRKDLYKIALNIENSIRYIKYIQQKNWKILDAISSKITHKSLEVSNKIATRSAALAIISVLLGILSVCLALGVFS